MSKSAISILQENCIVKFKKYPTYSIKDVSTIHTPRFSCQCVVDNLRSSGIASSKSAAKTMAAEEMTKKLKIMDANYIRPAQRGTIFEDDDNNNHIGKLNEYCQKNCIPLPTYAEDSRGGIFISKCQEQTLLATGKGQNKKIAKQESAKAMLELLKANKSAKRLTSTYNSKTNIELINIYPNHELTTDNSITHTTDAYKFPPNAFNAVGRLNEYCAEHNFKHPEYFECGVDGGQYKVKCLYQSLRTFGYGVISKNAKQDSAKEMLKLIGVIKPMPAEDLIDLSPVNSPTTAMSNIEISNIFKNLSTSKTITNNDYPMSKVSTLIPDSENSSMKSNNLLHSNRHQQLYQRLKDGDILYNIVVLQKAEPCIVSFTGRKGDGNEWSLLECGDTFDATMEVLLMKAVKLLNC